MKVLLVEDDAGIRALLEQSLRRRGHEVVALDNAALAWETHQQESFPLLLIDWHVPGSMDGLELCRRIRALPHGATSEILVMTASMEPAGLTMALDAGATDYLQKPFSAHLLEVRLAIAERHVAERAARAAAEGAQRQSEARYRGLIDTSPDGIVLTDLGATVLLANRRAAHLLGYAAPEEIIGRSFTRLLEAEEGAGAALSRQTRAEPGGGGAMEVTVQRHDEPPSVAEVSTSLIHGEDSQPVAMTAVIRDITTRRQGEEVLRKNEQIQRAFADLTLLATSTFDIDQMLPRICEVAAAAFDVVAVLIYLLDGPDVLRLAGASTPAVPVGLRLDVTTQPSAEAQAVREQRVVHCAELPPDLPRPLRRIAEMLPAARSVSAAPLFGTGEVDGVVVLLGRALGHVSPADLDYVTQMAHIIGTALRQARLYRREHEVAERLRQIERWRASFLRVMAHEVRTPLGQISGFADLASGEADHLSARGQRYLANVRAAAARLETLVQRSFDLMRLSEEEAVMARAPVDLERLVDGVVATYRPAAEAGGVALAYEGPGAQAMVAGDMQRLRQALEVLLENAVKFTPAGGSIAVGVYATARQVMVQVHDSGPGIAPALWDDIFHAGQPEDSLTRHHGGTGLSLALAHRITALHGGTLHLAAVELGACFVLTLPRETAG